MDHKDLFFLFFLFTSGDTIAFQLRNVVESRDLTLLQAVFFTDVLDELFGPFQRKRAFDFECQRDIFVDVFDADIFDWDGRVLLIVWIEGEINFQPFAGDDDFQISLRMQTESVA